MEDITSGDGMELVGSGVVPNEPSSEEAHETFHIYVLSFAYGIFVLLVVGHLIWRWQWRRKKLSRFRSHVPGDKSFKCQKIRQKLEEDFATIQTLSSDPRLIHPDLPPNVFGGTKESCEVPTHWYRMKVFDAAADLVAGNRVVLRGSIQTSGTLSLPEFLGLLQQQGIAVGNQQALVEQCIKLYSLARYEDGTFDEEQFEEFNYLIQRVQQLLSPEVDIHVSDAPSSYHPASHSTATTYQHSSLMSQDSHEPLLGSIAAETPVEATEKQLSSTPGHITSTKTTKDASSWRRRKPPELEISPLMLHSDSERRGESLSPLSGRDVYIGTQGSRQIVTVPETPV